MHYLPPDLSIIIPAGNEVHYLAALIDDLRRQQGIRLQIVVADSNSTDGTLEIAEQGADVVVPGGRGRGRSMNAGRRAATARFLLFLHADSQFSSPVQLRDALAALHTASRRETRIAGHFSIKFAWTGSAPVGVGYYEAKSALGRAGTINGDQGLLISAAFFDELGGYNETLSFLEDRILDLAVRERGCWMLLPHCLRTSGRRFETEGFASRMALSAIVLCQHTIGNSYFFDDSLPLYRPPGAAHERADPTMTFKRLIASLRRAPFPVAARWFFFETGEYVRSNAWQLAFCMDYRRHGASCVLNHPWLDVWDRKLDRWSDWFGPRALATAVTWSWFAMAWAHHARSDHCVNGLPKQTRRLRSAEQ